MKTSRTNFPDATQTPGSSPPPGRTPQRLRMVTLALALLVSLGALFYVIQRREPRGAHTQEGKKDVYYCPMHPSYHWDKPSLFGKLACE